MTSKIETNIRNRKKIKKMTAKISKIETYIYDFLLPLPIAKMIIEYIQIPSYSCIYF